MIVGMIVKPSPREEDVQLPQPKQQYRGTYRREREREGKQKRGTKAAAPSEQKDYTVEISPLMR